MTSFDPANAIGFFMDDFSLALLNIITPIGNITQNTTINKTSNITTDVNKNQNNQSNMIILPNNIS
jgi:hypothetical protein